jgi:hypothetical protein
MEENVREAVGISIALGEGDGSVIFEISDDEITIRKTMSADDAKQFMRDFAEITGYVVGE